MDELVTAIVLTAARHCALPTSSTDVPQTVRLLARKRDVNSRGKGVEEYRQVALPDGNCGYRRAIWVDKLPGAVVVSDDWCPLGIRAAQRRCSTYVELETSDLPEGSIAISIDKPIGRPGRADKFAGFISHDGEIKWGLGIKSVGTRKVAGEWITVIRFDDGRKIEV